jgi:hypothetical protein
MSTIAGGATAGGATVDGAAVEAALGWSAKQGRILTGGGVAEEVYCASRGYPFDPEELPHHHLVSCNTRAQFGKWAEEARAARAAAEEAGAAAVATVAPRPPPDWLVGAWSRPIFSGGGEQSTDTEETCYNLVTSGGPFIDIRIPTARDRLLEGRDWESVAKAVEGHAQRPLETLSDMEVSCSA